MRVLVTGATGFIGRALVPRLQRDGHTVVAWVRSPARARGLLGAAVELVQADIRDPELPVIIRSHGPFDLVSHHAALKDVRLALLDPRADADVNVLGTLNVIRAAVDAEVGRLTFASHHVCPLVSSQRFPHLWKKLWKIGPIRDVVRILA